MAVHTAEGVISYVQADFADGWDNHYLTSICGQVQTRLKKNELIMTDLLADAGSSNGSNYKFLEQKDITGWIPVFGKYKHEIEGFPYIREKDEYTCPMGKSLPFKGFHTNLGGTVLKNYWAVPKECKVCPMRSTRAKKAICKNITRTMFDEQYSRAYQRQQTKRGRQMKKLRQSKVEPVFGSLTQFYGPRKISVLGKAGAHKVMLMAAIAFNFKKYLQKGGQSYILVFLRPL